MCYDNFITYQKESHMDEFYTPETYYAIAMQEIDMAHEYEMDEAYNEESDDFTGYEYEDYDNDHLIDSYMEGSLFGWDA